VTAWFVTAWFVTAWFVTAWFVTAWFEMRKQATVQCRVRERQNGLE